MAASVDNLGLLQVCWRPSEEPILPFASVDNYVDNFLRMWISGGKLGRRWWMSAHQRPPARRPLATTVDDTVERRGIAVDSLNAIHRRCGRDWGGAGDGVDGPEHFPSTVHNWG